MDFFERLARIRQGILIYFVLLLASIAATLILVSVQSAFAVLPAILIAIFLVLALHRRVRYGSFYKNNLAEALLDDIFDDLIYSAKGGIAKEEIVYSDTVGDFDDYYAEDYIDAKYKGLAFRQSDVRIMRWEEGYGKHRTLRTVFDGRWMIFEGCAPSGFQLRISEISRITPQPPVGQGIALEPVYVEDKCFHRHFKVYTNDAKRARYILTPSFREAILRVNYEIPGEIMLAFKGGNLHAAIHNTRNAFEPPTFRRLDKKSLKDEIFRDTRVITAFVDALLAGSPVHSDGQDEPS